MLRAGVGATAALGLGAAAATRGMGQSGASAPVLRGPGALPYPSMPVGQYTAAFPFDHLVLVMQENHSFDNYLGMLPLSGQPLADGFTFNKAGEPVNWNLVDDERMYVYHQPGDIGAQDSGSQSCSRATGPAGAAGARRHHARRGLRLALLRPRASRCSYLPSHPASHPRWRRRLQWVTSVSGKSRRTRGTPRGRPCRRGGRNAH